MLSAEEFLCLLNCTIRFTTPEGDVYEGLLKRVLPSIQTITVGKLYLLPNRTRMGILNFMFREVSNLKVISHCTNFPKEVIEETKLGAPNYLRTETDELLDFYGDNEDHTVTGTIPDQGEYVIKLPPHLSHCVPSDSHIIDSFNSDFNLAIEKIMAEKSIGLCLEGPKISRFGTLTWVCISTSSCVYLFDIIRLGKAVFKNALKSVLEDAKIQKIMHDCRLPSDCLYHIYKVRLVNVFDTQVADSLVLMQGIKDRRVNKQVNSLDTCLRYFLEIPDEYLHAPRDFVMDENSVDFHGLRPLCHKFRDLMIQNVIYLQLLQRELQTALLSPLRRATDIYLNVIQKASENELLIAPPVLDEFPPELTLEGIQIVRFQDYEYLPPVVSSGPPYRKLNNPFEEYKAYYKKYNVGRRNYYSSTFHTESYSEDRVEEFVEPEIVKKKITVPNLIPEKGNDDNWYKDNFSFAVEKSKNREIGCAKAMKNHSVKLETVTELEQLLSKIKFRKAVLNGNNCSEDIYSAVQKSKNGETGCVEANMNYSVKTETATDLEQLLSKIEFRKAVLKGDNCSGNACSAVQMSSKAIKSKLFPEKPASSKDKFQIKDSTVHNKENKNSSFGLFSRGRCEVKSADDVSLKTKTTSLFSDAPHGVQTFSNIDKILPHEIKKELPNMEPFTAIAEDDIWTALRAECINDYPDDEPRPKLNLIPAGMNNF